MWVRKRPPLLGWTVLYNVLLQFLEISIQPELIRNLYWIDFLPLRGHPKDSPIRFGSASGPDTPGGPCHLAAVANACGGMSRGVTSSKNNIFSIFYISLRNVTAFGCGAHSRTVLLPARRRPPGSRCRCRRHARGITRCHIE